MVIDDNMANLNLARMALEERYNVVPIPSGEIALASLGRIIPNLILLGVDYIKKPFSFALLLKRVGLHLQLQNYSKNFEKMVENKTKVIIEKMDTEAALCEMEERGQIMHNATPLCCNLWTPDYHNMSCNNEALRRARDEDF